MNLDERRIGKFYLSDRLVRHSTEACLELLSTCLIIRAEMQFYRNEIEYIAYNDTFDPIEDHEMPPLYVLLMSEQKNAETGTITRTPVGFQKAAA